MTQNAGLKQTNISRWFDCEYRVYTEDRSLYERLIRRKGCSHGASYAYPDGTKAWDVVIPEEQLDSVRKLIATDLHSRARKGQSRPSKTTAKQGLNRKDLHEMKSSQSESNPD